MIVMYNTECFDADYGNGNGMEMNFFSSLHKKLMLVFLSEL